MGNKRLSKHSSIDWLAKEPFATHIDAYMQFLANRSYSANTFSNYFYFVRFHINIILMLKGKQLASCKRNLWRVAVVDVDP